MLLIHSQYLAFLLYVAPGAFPVGSKGAEGSKNL